jgi:hypothetical protein
VARRLDGNIQKYARKGNVTARGEVERVDTWVFFIDVLLSCLLGSMSHYYASYEYKLQV